jgi:LysM repeat protein
LLLEVSSPEAIELAHLVLGGTQLAYTVWPAGAGPPPTQQPLDERNARALLGLPAVSTPSQLTSLPATQTPAPAETPRPQTYSVQAGESLYGVATRLGVDAGALWWANRSLVDPTVPLVAGTILQVPLFTGFLYQVQPGDTWDSVAAIFGVAAADLVRRNELPESATLVSGMLLIVPRQT